jgi:predicted ATP-dependent Lon-type protease
MADGYEKEAALSEDNGFSPAQMPTDPFNYKVEKLLGDRVILKPLTRWNEAYKEFPWYVMEYLVSRYVDAREPVAGQHKIDRIPSEHYTESSKKELIKSQIKENGEYTLLGQLMVRLDQAKDYYWADVPALGDNTVRIAPRVLEQYRNILMTSGACGPWRQYRHGHRATTASSTVRAPLCSSPDGIARYGFSGSYPRVSPWLGAAQNSPGQLCTRIRIHD